jgi:hypothetical protein
MRARRDHGWAYWTALAGLPVVPVVAYYLHGSLLVTLAILAYFSTIAVGMRSRLIACTLIGAILDAVIPSSTCVLGARLELKWVWFGIAAGLIFETAMWLRSKVVYPVAAPKNCPLSRDAIDAPH